MVLTSVTKLQQHPPHGSSSVAVTDSNAKILQENSQVHLEAEGHNQEEKKILYHARETVGNFFLVQSGNFQLPAEDSSLKDQNLYQ